MIKNALRPLVMNGKGVGAQPIETLRGFACLLVVVYHVVGMNETSGLRVPPDSVWRWLVMSFDYVRMPLITGLTGYVFAHTIEKSADWATFLRHKAFVLLVPALFTALVYWALRCSAYGEEASLQPLFWNGYLHLWYLYALFAIFVVAALCRSVLVKVRRCVVLFLLSLVLPYALPPLPHLFSLTGAIYLLPFFIAGCAYRNCAATFRHPVSLLIAATIAAIVLADQQYRFFAGDVGLRPAAFLPTLCGCALFVLMMAMTARSPMLEQLGHYSFPIFLWHAAANAGFRALVWPTVDSIGLLLFLGIAAGIGVPILLQQAVERFVPAALPLLGGKRQRLNGARRHSERRA